MFTNLRDALEALDPEDNKAWTADGAPSVQAVNSLLKGLSVTRIDITKAFPNFTRTNREFPKPPEPEIEATEEPEVVSEDRPPTLAEALRHYLDTQRRHKADRGPSALDLSFSKKRDVRKV